MSQPSQKNVCIPPYDTTKICDFPDQYIADPINFVNSTITSNSHFDLNCKNYNDTTILYEIAKRNDIDSLRALYESPNVALDLGFLPQISEALTPLALATFYKSYSVTAYIVEKIAFPNNYLSRPQENCGYHCDYNQTTKSGTCNNAIKFCLDLEKTNDYWECMFGIFPPDRYLVDDDDARDYFTQSTYCTNEEICDFSSAPSTAPTFLLGLIATSAAAIATTFTFI